MYQIPTPEEDILLERIGSLKLVQLGRSSLPGFFEFVFGVFKAQFGLRFKIEISKQEYAEFIADETSFDGQGMYAALLAEQPRRIVGGFRAVKYDGAVGFPTERIFNISVPQLAAGYGVQPGQIWHGGCFAMDTRWLLKHGYRLREVVRRVYIHSLASMLRNEARYILGETDELIERLHAHNGFYWKPVSGWAEYWGSTRATILDVRATAAGPLYRRELQQKGLIAA